jgi:hypothetical protein
MCSKGLTFCRAHRRLRVPDGHSVGRPIFAGSRKNEATAELVKWLHWAGSNRVGRSCTVRGQHGFRSCSCRESVTDPWGACFSARLTGTNTHA